jgi:septal ring factor EnvC (AmiA/AmiB activator)
MTRFPIPGDHPEAGWLNPHRWVGREEYDEYTATRPSNDDAQSQLRMMLQAINPAMAQRISRMNEAQKQAAREEQAPEMQERMAQLHQLGRDYWEKQTSREENQ